MALPELILLAAGIAVFTLAMLAILDTIVRNDAGIHDLKVRVATLRNNYTEQLRDLMGIEDEGEIIDVIPIDELEVAEDRAEQPKAAA